MSEPASHGVDARSVAKRARRGISWNLAGAVATNAMRVAVIAVLGRALTSTDFGIVAAAISVNVILFTIRDVGIGHALVQRKEIDRAHIQTAFTVSLAMGVALSLLLLLGAPVVADLYDIPEAGDVIRALAVLFALRGLSATSLMLCQRELRFRAIATIDAASFATGSAVSIACAVSGMGPWALVAGYLVEQVLSTALFLRVNPPPLVFGIDRQRFRELMSFGAGQTVAQIAGMLATYGDNFVVGNMLGARALGFYTRAYELIRFPSTVFASVVGTVLFPAFSRLQHDRERLAINLRRITMVNALLLLPASAALVVLAPEAIRILVGPGWDEAVVPFQILATTMLLRTNQKLGALVVQSSGAVNAIAACYVVYMIAVVGGAAIGVRWGIPGVAVSTAIAIATVCAGCMLLAARVSGLSVSAMAVAHLPGLALAAVVVAVAWPSTLVLREAGLPVVVIFAAVGAASVAVCVVMLVGFLRSGSEDLRWLRGELMRLRRRRGAKRAPMNAETPTSIS